VSALGINVVKIYYIILMKRYICLFAVLFTLLVFSCGEVSDFKGGGGGGYDALCGVKEYKTGEQFCLNDEVYSLCSGMEYDVDKDFCHSDGSVYPRCGGNMYNPKSYFCFDSKVYQKCGTDTYNPSESFCNGNNVYELCDGLEYKPTMEFCSDEDYKIHILCNGKEYNLKENICYKNNSGKEILYTICPSGNGEVSNDGCKTKLKMCGKELYNIATSFCYSDAVFELCGTLEYDISTEFCSEEGGVYEKCHVKVGVDDFGRPIYEDKRYDTDSQYCNKASNAIEDKGSVPRCWEPGSDLEKEEKKTKFCCFGKAYLKTDDYFCYKDELYPICIANTLVPPSDTANYRPRPTYDNDSLKYTTQYNPAYYGCFEQKIYPKCTNDGLTGPCVDKTLKRCKQLGSGRDYIIDPLPEMTCNSNGAITGTSKAGYKVAQIGDQVWLAENLKADLKNSVCGDCNKYGRLYDWATGMGIEENYNYEEYNFQYDLVSGPCPTGFYLPRDDDWQRLVDYAGGAAIAGGRLKSTTGWSDNGNGLDAYGFNALPGGSINEIFAGDGFNGTEGKISKWWSTTQHPNPDAYYWAIYSSDTEIRNFFQPKGSNKAYIRCVLYYK